MNEAALVCDDWLNSASRSRCCPSSRACGFARRAFAAKVERPNEDPPDLAGALEAAATMLAHDGGGAAADDRASRALTAAGGGRTAAAAGGAGWSRGLRGGDFRREGDRECPRGCGTVFASKANSFGRAPKGGAGGGRGPGPRGARAGPGGGAGGGAAAGADRPHRGFSAAEEEAAGGGEKARGRSERRVSADSSWTRVFTHFRVVCTFHPCLFMNDFFAAIIAAVGVGSKNTGKISCGIA